MVKRFSEETQKIRGCGAADDIAKTLGADVVNRDGLRVRDLPGPLQQIMLDLPIGQFDPTLWVDGGWCAYLSSADVTHLKRQRRDRSTK